MKLFFHSILDMKKLYQFKKDVKEKMEAFREGRFVEKN